MVVSESIFNPVNENVQGLPQLKVREILTLTPMVLLIFWIGLIPMLC